MIESVHQTDGVTVVKLTGGLDSSTSGDVKESLRDIVEDGNCKLVVDLESLEYIDSAGLGVLVGCLRRCVSAGGDMCLARVSKFIRSVFELTRLTRVFQLVESVPEAVRAIAEASRE